MIININNPPLHAVEISRQGENEFREIVIDVSSWLSEYPDGKISVIYCRPDGELYPVIVNSTESPITWRPTATDTAVSGVGAIEVRIQIGDVLGKSCTIAAKVLGALGAPGGTPAAPAPDWAQTVTEDADRAEAAAGKAEAASTHVPQISASKTWLVWDANKGEYVDTGVSAAGETPEVDDTMTQPGQAADAAAVGDRLSALSEEIANLGGGDDVSVEPAEDDIPKVFFGGALQQTKDSAVVPFRYISKTRDISGYAEIKAQGNSSMSYPKKNQTVKLFKDAGCTEKLKVDFKGWGKQNKHVYKANWIDITHARNVVSARLWADIVKSRANYAELPELLRTSPNQGAVDGFPVKVYAAGVYQGRYTLNIPKDKWAFNMDDTLDNHCVLCGENYESGCFRAAANINGDDWSDEIHDVVPVSIKTRWNEVISFVMNSTDDEFKMNLGQYFDIQSLIDYHLFGLQSCGLDAYGKNQIYMTYDGQKWIASMYDMDSTWGLYWNGSKFVATDYARTSYEDFASTQSSGEGNLLYIRLEQCFYSELQARWTELKNGALSIENIINRFERFTDIAPAELVKEDYARTTGGGAFTGIPSKDTNNIQQIRAYAVARHAWCDTYVAGLTPPEEVPCTGISLSSETLTFTEAGTQTLTATVTPDNCTDVVVWESDNTSIATVDGGVVTAVANGSATITATCGEYFTTCAVVVSGLATTAIDYSLDALAGVTWTSGSTYDNTTGELTTVSGEHCTSKFNLQDCAYELSGAGGTYNALFVWDSDGTFLHTLEWKGTINGMFTAVSGYKYAIKTYSTSTIDTSAFKLMPVDNRASAVDKFNIPLADYDFTFTKPDAYIKLVECDISNAFIASGITSKDEYLTKINSSNILLICKSGEYIDSKYIDVSSDKQPLSANLNYYDGKMLLQFYGFSTAEAANEYFATNGTVLTIN